MRLGTLGMAVGVVVLALVLVATCPVDTAHGREADVLIRGETTMPDAPVNSTVHVPRTGQRTCYHQEGWVIDCAGTGQDGDIQAGAAWPDPRFELTYCDDAGPCPSQADDCDHNPITDIALDRLTGLVWTRSGATLPYSVTWEVALDFANNLVLCGYDDWRMPNTLELQSMTNAEFAPYTYPYPEYNWLHEAGFVDVYTEFYWSSTASDARPGWFYAARNMFGGEIDIEPGVGGGNDWAETVWPVRAGQNGVPDPAFPVNLWKTGQTESVLPGDDGDWQMGLDWPDPRFTNPDGSVPVTEPCVLDNLTGLVWPRNVWPDPYENDTWQQSLDRANSFSLCGYEDWRLPNTWEMLSLVDFSQSYPALPAGHPFENLYSDWSWYVTSTTFAWWTDWGWGLDLSGEQSGWLDFHVKSPDWWYNMPVRGGTIGIPLRPDLTINYPYGYPGSYLTITGLYWAPNGTVYASVNGVDIGSQQISGAGGFTFAVQTDPNGIGHYRVEVTTVPPKGHVSAAADGQEAAVDFWLTEDAPLREWDGTEPVYVLPPGIGFDHAVYMPAALRSYP